MQGLPDALGQCLCSAAIGIAQQQLRRRPQGKAAPGGPDHGFRQPVALKYTEFSRTAATAASMPTRREINQWRQGQREDGGREFAAREIRIRAGMGIEQLQDAMPVAMHDQRTRAERREAPGGLLQGCRRDGFAVGGGLGHRLRLAGNHDARRHRPAPAVRRRGGDACHQ